MQTLSNAIEKDVFHWHENMVGSPEIKPLAMMTVRPAWLSRRHDNADNGMVNEWMGEYN